MGAPVATASDDLLPMPRKVSYYAQTEQPMNWFRAFVSGAVGAAFLMTFLDIFYMLGITPFTLEYYVGSMILSSPYGVHNFTIGVIATWIIGGLWGFLYAYCFEYVFRRSSTRLGAFLGMAHAAVAAVVVFPFFQVVHEFQGTEPTPPFGFFGLGMGPATFILLFFGHVFFGIAMGAFYGPVRVYRVRTRVFEPGDSGYPGESDVITWEEDHPERAAM